MVAVVPSESLTDAQRRIVASADGPLVVIAGAGSGKTRVIVERVRWLLQAKGNAAEGPRGDLLPSAVRSDRAESDPFDGPLLPEQILVLTYDVKAARELGERIEQSIGTAARARINVGNFHSFCHRVLTESATDAGLPARPDVLDGIGQLLLLRDIRRDLPLRYYSGKGNPNYWLDQFVAFINRAKDELVTPDDFDAFVLRERDAAPKASFVAVFADVRRPGVGTRLLGGAVQGSGRTSGRCSFSSVSIGSKSPVVRSTTMWL